MDGPIFIDDEIYLHHINLANYIQVHNFLLGGGGYATPASLDVEELKLTGADRQRIETVKKQQSYYSLSSEELKISLDLPGYFFSSPRMQILGSASQFRNGQRILRSGFSCSPKQWSDEIEGCEDGIIKISEIEIEFEMGRRLYAPKAPSRITCLFMVENNWDGKLLLAEFYEKTKIRPYKPELLELGVCSKQKMLKADCNWYDKYRKCAQEQFIENYWKGIPSDTPKWEILFEGMVGLRNEDQRKKLKDSRDFIISNAQPLIPTA